MPKATKSHASTARVEVSAVAAGVNLSARIAAEVSAAAAFGTTWSVVLPPGYPRTTDEAIATVQSEAAELRRALGPLAERTSESEAALRRSVALSAHPTGAAGGAAAAVTRRVVT